MNDLRVRVDGDASGYDATMAKVRRKANEFAAAVSGNVTGGFTGMVTGLVGATALSMLSRATMGYADEIEETSSRIGVSIKRLQEWRFAAEQSGASIQNMTMFIEQLADAAADPKNAKKFSRMGIKPEGMTPEELLLAVNRFAQKNSTTEVRGALDGIVASRSLGRMMNLLQSDLEALGKTAQDAGAVMRDEMVHKLATLNDQFSILSQILYTQFGPALLTVAKAALKTYGAISGTASEFGAKTAGMSISEILLGPFLSKDLQNKIFKRVANDPNQKVFNDTGEKLFAEKVTSIENMIKLFENWKPSELPKLQMQDAKAEKKNAAKQFEADSLAKIGGFTASSMLFNPQLNVAVDQLKELKEINRALKSSSGINGYFQ